MMRKTLIASAVAAVLATPALAAPTTGAYTTDPQQEWVQDRLTESLGTPNTILCFMSALRADAMVNEGDYLALVDLKQCDSGERGGNDNSSNTNAGASSQVEYTRVTVNSSRASNSAPMIVKAWFELEQDGPGGQSLTVDMSAYASISESPSDSNPNGVFSMSFCGVMSGGNPANGCIMQGEMSATGNELRFAESFSPGGGVSENHKMTITRTGTGGSGRIEFTEMGQTKAGAFSYNQDFFRRGTLANGSDAQCFSRKRADADISVWRYGVYEADGNRADLANPGFSVSALYNGTTHWGYAGFWGVFLPTVMVNGNPVNLLNQVTQVQRASPGSNTAGITYDLTKANGKLYSMTRKDGTLAQLKGQGVILHLPGGVLENVSGQSEVVWNGSELQVTRTAGEGGNLQPLNPAVALTASALRTQAPFMKALQGWSQSAGGEVRIEVPQASGSSFADSTPVASRTRNAVVPGAAGAPSSLVCVNRCPKGGLVSGDFSGAGSPFANITVKQWNGTDQQVSSEFAFNPVLTANARSYTFTSGGVLNDGASNAVDASDPSLGLSGRYQHGLQSGRLIDQGSDTHAEVRCTLGGQGYTPSPTGEAICPWLVDGVSIYYTYETGPNPWNRYVGLSTGGAAVTLDPPKIFNLAVNTTDTTVKAGSPLNGSTVRLQFNGFGDLQGIPGVCVNMTNNQKVECGGAGQQSVRWVPAFSIKDGAAITAEDGVTTYFVKALDRELRFAKVTDAQCTGLDLPFGASLPDNPTANAGTLNGNKPTVGTVPAVIHGVPAAE